MRASLRSVAEAAFCVGLAVALGLGVNFFGMDATAASDAGATGGSHLEPPKDPALAAINDAAAGLTKEYVAFVKDPTSSPLRTHSDYFKSHPSTDVTDASVAAALSRSFGDNLREETYVKWQLLSAVPGNFDPKLAPQALAAFQEHAALSERPGVSAQSKRELDQSVRGQTSADTGKINENFENSVQAVATRNEPVLTYLDDLYAKLPPSEAVLQAGFAEAVQRASLGIDSTLSDAVVASGHTWVSGQVQTADAVKIRELTSALIKMMGGPTPPGKKAAGGVIEPAGGEMGLALAGEQDANDQPGISPSFIVLCTVRAAAPKSSSATPGATAVTFPPSIYSGVSWEETKKALVWAVKKPKFVTKKKIEDFQAALDDVIAHPNSGLKFQTEK